MRKPISPEKIFAIILRFLATGETFHSLVYQFRIHRVAIGKFVPEVCKAIYHCLKDEFLRIPSTADKWESIAEETYNRWHFPNGFAAADGKHIAFFHPRGSESEL